MDTAFHPKFRGTAIPVHNMAGMSKLVTACLLALVASPPVGQAPDYAALYEQGAPFTRFLENVTARATDWKGNYAAAVVADDAAASVRALPARRRLLVVAEASCSDSASTIPHVARLVESAPDRLDMRIVDGDAGRAVMEQHRTLDGRAATPTIVVLDESGRFIAAWSERPAQLQKWYIEQKASLGQGELFSQKMKWYAADAGKSAVAEIAALLVK